MSVHYLMRPSQQGGWAVGATDGELWAPVHVTHDPEEAVAVMCRLNGWTPPGMAMLLEWDPADGEQCPACSMIYDLHGHVSCPGHQGMEMAAGENVTVARAMLDPEFAGEVVRRSHEVMAAQPLGA